MTFGKLIRWLHSHRGKIGIALALLIVGGVWWKFLVNEDRFSVVKLASAIAKANAPSGVSGKSDQTASSKSLEEQRLILIQQFELVDHTLCSYKEATKYPPTSRPISEHPDQVYPNKPVLEQHAMRKKDGGVDDAFQIQTSQSRIYVASGEIVVFTIKATDKEGNVVPLNINRVVANGITLKGSRDGPQQVLSIQDGGIEGDVLAGDGIYSGVLAPAQSSFANFSGTIRTEVQYFIDGEAGIVLFDIIYTAESPATWTGQIRETLEGGSLNYFLKANVLIPGRYIVTARVDDAKGKPVALVTFNDLLGQGVNEIHLTVAGNLLRDKEPALPLALRDVYGYLLKEDVEPDRALMPRLEGNTYVSKNYPLNSFSDAEWQSEERSRYLTEYGKDVELAKAALIERYPDQSRPQLPQSECAQQ
jgi:hypothetical protein